jgi:hypothetical protein
MFDKEVMETLFMFKRLDPYYRSIAGREGAIVPSFSAAYLERRVLNEPSDGLPGLRRIRYIAERLAQESTDGRDVSTYIEQLCQLVVTRGYPCTIGIWESWSRTNEFDIEDHICFVALGTKTMSFVDRWLADGKPLPVSAPWLGYTRQLVAEVGTYDLLAAAMTREDKELFHKSRLLTLMHVANAGKIDFTRFVFGFEHNGWSWEFSRDRRVRHKEENESGLARFHTPSKEVFDFLTEKRILHCIDRQFGEDQYTDFLRHCAVKGWAEMAACYLDLGASVDGLTPKPMCCIEQKRPLLDACSYGHQEVVKVLLDHGASTSAPALEQAAGNGHLRIVQMLLASGAEHGDALSRAAAKGYGDVVEVLLNHGAEVRDSSASLLVSAIEHEHTAMFRLLIERGCEVRDTDTAAKCVRAAREQGLESMLQLLREFGVGHAESHENDKNNTKA